MVSESSSGVWRRIVVVIQACVDLAYILGMIMTNVCCFGLRNLIRCAILCRSCFVHVLFVCWCGQFESTSSKQF